MNWENLTCSFRALITIVLLMIWLGFVAVKNSSVEVTCFLGWATAWEVFELGLFLWISANQKENNRNI